MLETHRRIIGREDLLEHMKTHLAPFLDLQRSLHTHMVDMDGAVIILAADEAVTGRPLVCQAMAPSVHLATDLLVHLAMGLSGAAVEDHSGPEATPSSVEEVAPLVADVDADEDHHNPETSGQK